MECPYCQIERLPGAEIVLRGEGALFFRAEEHQGALKHSGMIIPVAHRETVFDLAPGEIQATFTLLRRVKAWLDERYRPDGYNVGWNCGAVGGQTVFHAHLHVIPRFAQEPLAGVGIRNHLRSEANRW